MRAEGFKGTLVSALMIALLIVLTMPLSQISPTSADQTNLGENEEEVPPGYVKIEYICQPPWGGALVGAKSPVPLGTHVEVEAFPNQGWRFVGWKGDVPPNYTYQRLGFIADRENMTIIAEFEFIATLDNLAPQKQPSWRYQFATTFPNAKILSASMTSTGDYIVIGGHEYKYVFNTIENCWEPERRGKVSLLKSDGELVWSFSVGIPVRKVDISSDGDYIVAGDDHGNIYLFSKEDNLPLWSSNVYCAVNDLAISSDGNYIVAGTLGGGPYPTVFLFDRTQNVPVWAFHTEDWVGSVAISSDGNYIAVGSNDYKVYFFGKQENIPLWSYQTGHWVHSVAISASGEYIAAAGDRAYLFRRDTGVPLWNYETKDPQFFPFIAISADGSYVVANAENTKICLFAYTDNTPLWSYPLDSVVCSVSISSDGNYIAACSQKYLYFFDKSGKLLWTFPVESIGEGYVVQFTPVEIAISGDGKYVAVGDPMDYLDFFSTSVKPAELPSVFQVVLVFLKPDGSPLPSTTIYYGTSAGQEMNYLGATDSEGKIILSDPAFANRIVYFSCSDGRYSGSALIDPSWGEIQILLTQTKTKSPRFPLVALIGLIILVCCAVGIWKLITFLRESRYKAQGSRALRIVIDAFTSFLRSPSANSPNVLF